MIYYLLFVAFCIILFIFHNWFVGYNLEMHDAVAIFIMAAFPGMNVMMVVWVIIDLLGYTIPKSGILLKGRK